MNAPLPEQFPTLQEIVTAARRNLAPGPWGYLIGGAETETTVRRNRQALDTIAFRPRVLRDVSSVDSGASFLGRKVRLPVMLAPVGGMESFVEGGAAAAARAAAEFGVPQMLSSVCHPGLEATAAAADTLRVFQLYVRGDDAWVDDWVRRAKGNGFSAFCFTVDVASYSRRERDLLTRFVKPWRADAGEGKPYQAGLSWDQVKRFKDKHDMPLIIKGIATAEDAAIAVEHGIEVVYVSNHGGRQLDHGLGSIAVLPEVLAAVGGRSQVWVDGGFMRGADVIKAIALGAQCVGLGRLACLGLAAAGVPGLVRTLALLEEEIRVCLALIGVTSFAELTPRHLAPAPPVMEAGMLSAFPLMTDYPDR
jgi:glycolate oxidase